MVTAGLGGTPAQIPRYRTPRRLGRHPLLSQTDALTEFLPPKPSWLSEPPPVERLRHCWATADEHGRMPALLLEWRETPDGWQGRVVRPVLDMEDDEWRPREERLPVEGLEQA